MIQRDYAQGREDENTKKIRDKLLDKINSNDDKPIKFDFVYGYIDGRKIFIPLDGQQRLTTLFLLHWYIAATNKDKNEHLKKFRYETRTSSTDFMQALVDSIGNLKILPAEKDDKNKSKKTILSTTIKNSAWFFTSWENDPTIAAMLVMLDAIHERNITKNKLEKITFDFINMGDFKLSDDLYLKMNARGIQLTSFENFKAFFEKHLEEIDDNLKNDERSSLKKRFTDSIDNKWLDTFWNLKYTESDVIDESYRTIDKPFMRFFWYMTEMLYFNSNHNISNEVKSLSYNTDSLNEPLIEMVYSTEYEIKYLFDTLDKLGEINSSCTGVLSSQYETGKVALFTKKYNLLQELVKTGEIESEQNKLIIFTIINYAYKNLHKNPSEHHFHDLVCVVRNLLIRVREQKDISFSSKLNRNDFNKAISIINLLTQKESAYEVLPKYDDKINQLMINNQQSESVKSEIKKAKLINNNQNLKNIIFELEDHEQIRGAIHNFMPEDNLEEIKNKIEQRKDTFHEIWSQKCSLIVRSLLSLDIYQVWVKGSNLDGLWFFGSENNWEVILTYYVDESANYGLKNKNFIVNFLKKYHEADGATPPAKLNKIIDDYLTYEYSKDANLRNWRFYFVKYENMACEYSNIYSWGGNFDIRSLCDNTLKSYHINPYIKIVWDLVTHWKRGNNRILTTLDVEGNSIQVIKYGAYARFANRSPLSLIDNVDLFCEEKGWRIEPALQPIKQEKKFNLVQDQDNGYFYLQPTKDKDMIEIAVEFISELYRLENPPNGN